MSNMENMKDDQLKAFFQENKPEISGADDFMAMLSSRLDEVDAAAEPQQFVTVEDVLKIKAAATRQARLAIAAALAVGIVLGVSLSVSMFFHPVTLNDVGISPAEMENAAATAKSIFSKWSTAILMLFSFAACGLGLIPVLKK